MSSFTVENYFILFGLPQTFLQDNAKIKARYLELQKTIHPDNFTTATEHEKLLAVRYAATVNQAYQVLCNPLKRAIHLLKLEGLDAQSETDNTMPMAFLAEQMELRERLAEASENDNPEDEIVKIKIEIDNALVEQQQEFTKALDCVPKQLSDALLCIKKMQFYARIQQEILSFA